MEQELLYESKGFYKKKLRVYIDDVHQTYYIDMSAAFALKLISYNQWISNENGYYEITLAQLKAFEEIYEIVYEYFDVAIERKNFYNDVPIAENENMYNDQDKIKIDINNLKDIRNELLKNNIENNEYDSKEKTDVPKR